MSTHLIFDLDGTLVDSVSVVSAILNNMLEERGSIHRVDLATARSFVSLGGVPMVKALLGPACGDPELEIADFRRRYAGWRTPPASLFPQVRDGLAQLRDSGFTLAICSNKPQNLCEKVLDDLALDGYFQTVIGGAPDRRAKPHRDLLDLTLSALGAFADQCLFVGDSELDYEIAFACDVPFMLMRYGYARIDYDFSGVPGFDHFADAVAAICYHRAAIGAVPGRAARRVAA
jgi:phosphoglycolate phosphatase